MLKLQTPEKIHCKTSSRLYSVCCIDIALPVIQINVGLLYHFKLKPISKL